MCEKVMKLSQVSSFQTIDSRDKRGSSKNAIVIFTIELLGKVTCLNRFIQ